MHDIFTLSLKPWYFGQPHLCRSHLPDSSSVVEGLRTEDANKPYVSPPKREFRVEGPLVVLRPGDQGTRYSRQSCVHVASSRRDEGNGVSPQLFYRRHDTACSNRPETCRNLREVSFIVCTAYLSHTTLNSSQWLTRLGLTQQDVTSVESPVVLINR